MRETDLAALQDIQRFEHRVVVVNPEEAFKAGGGFAKLWRDAAFVTRLISVVWDEAHCVKTWAPFRHDYGTASYLRNILQLKPYLMPSATLADMVMDGVLNTLDVPRSRLEIIRRSNDRPNIYLTVRKMRHSARSFGDLDFLIPDAGRIRKFAAFFGSIEESIQAADILRKKLAPEKQYQIICFNSDVTPTLREEVTEEYKDGKLYGLYCTDSFGMVRDQIAAYSFNIALTIIPGRRHPGY